MKESGASAIVLLIVISIGISICVVLIEWMQSVQYERRHGRTTFEEVDSGPPPRGHEIGSYTLTF